MRSRSALVLFVASALAGCGAAPAPPRGPATVTVAVPGPAPADAPAPEPASAADAPAFVDAWPELFALVRSGRADALVDAELGLVLLDNPGAATTVSTHPTFAAAIADLARPPTLEHCPLRSAPLPEYSCETDAYSVEGCILTEPSHPKLVFLYEAFVHLSPDASVDGVLIGRLTRTQALATVTVTDTTSPTRWHFGVVAGRWRLLVIDVVTPCSA